MKRNNKRSLLAIFAAAIISASAFAGCTAKDNAEIEKGGTVILSVNPEIAISYDASGKVTNVVGINRDGQEIVKNYAGYQGKPCSDVVSALVNAIGDAGYFVEEVESAGSRQIVIELEKGSALPNKTFLSEIKADVLAQVQSHDWSSPIYFDGVTDYGYTNYGVTDYGKTDYDRTDYGIYQNNSTSSNETSSNATSSKDSSSNVTPSKDTSSNTVSTAPRPHTDYGVTDYGRTDYGRTDYHGTQTSSSASSSVSKPVNRTDYGKTDYNSTDYGRTNYDASDYLTTQSSAVSKPPVKDRTDYGKTDYDKTDYNSTDYGRTNYDATDYR